MKRKNKNLIAVFGVISTVLGVIGTIPSLIREIYSIAIIPSVLIIIGLIALAIAFGE